MAEKKLILDWKHMKKAISNVLNKRTQLGIQPDAPIILSDHPRIFFSESCKPQRLPTICHYFTDAHYYVSLGWIQGNEVQAVVWVQAKGYHQNMEKKIFPLSESLPPVQALVHTGEHRLLAAHCGDMYLRLFGDHTRLLRTLCIVPCRFSISCLSYDPKSGLLLSGLAGGVVLWIIEPSGRGLHQAQEVRMAGNELVQDISMAGPGGNMVVLCESLVRTFKRQSQDRFEEAKVFTSRSSGALLTCSFTCNIQGYLYVGNKAGHVQAWSLDPDCTFHKFQAHTRAVVCLRSRPEAHTLLTAGKEGLVKEWNLTLGNLLRQVKFQEELVRLEFFRAKAFFSQTTTTFSVYRLPCFYRLFSVCGSNPQEVRQVCREGKSPRISCYTQDGLLRFLCPLTGDLLILSWPFALLDQAIDWTYDSDREEIFVATGKPDVLVLDATRCPCTAKYLLCPSPKANDRVQCLAYGRPKLSRGLDGLVFCGHESGMVRVLSQHLCARIEKNLHSATVLALATLSGVPCSTRESSFLCSYGMDDYLQLSEAVFEGKKVNLVSLTSILCSCKLSHMILLPKSVAAITDGNCLRLWHYQDFLASSNSKPEECFFESDTLHLTRITSFDICLNLGIFVTGALDGTVKLWDLQGTLLARFDSLLKFGTLCFANERGDLLVTVNQSLYLVSCLMLLPASVLNRLSAMNIQDKMQETPKPFLPGFFLSFKSIFAPRYLYLGNGKQKLDRLETLINLRAIAFDRSVPHVVQEAREGPQPALEDKRRERRWLTSRKQRRQGGHQQHPTSSALQGTQPMGWDEINQFPLVQKFFGQGRKWIIAPDGYVPNSVVRAFLWPEGTPVFLRSGEGSTEEFIERESLPESRLHMMFPFWEEDFTTKLLGETRLNLARRREKLAELPRDIFIDNRTKLSQRMSGVGLNNTIQSLLNIMADTDPDKYQKCTNALVQIFATHDVAPHLRSATAKHLVIFTSHALPIFRKLAWEGLEKLGFLSHYFAIPLAWGLIDLDPEVHQKARNLMIDFTGVKTKKELLSLLHQDDIFFELQKQTIGDESLNQILGIRPVDLQVLSNQVDKYIKDDLTQWSKVKEQEPSAVTEMEKKDVADVAETYKLPEEAPEPSPKVAKAPKAGKQPRQPRKSSGKYGWDPWKP